MREISTQLAIGATRAALVRQLLTESAVLAFLGGVSGIVLGFGCIQGFMALLPYTPSPSGPAFHLDVRVLGFALLASTAAVPLWTGSSVSYNPGGDGVGNDQCQGGSFRQPHFRHAGAAHSDCRANRVIDDPADWRRTVLKAFVKAQEIDLGFNPSHVLLVSIDPSLRGYSAEKAVLFNQQLLRQTAGLPGVESASIAQQRALPLRRFMGHPLTVTQPRVGNAPSIPQPTRLFRVISRPCRYLCFAAGSSRNTTMRVLPSP